MSDSQMRCPLVITFRTDGLICPMTVHDALKDSSEGSYTDPSTNENGVFRVEDSSGRCSIRSVNVDGLVKSSHWLTPN